MEHAFLISDGAAVAAATPSAPQRRGGATRDDYAGRTPFEALTGVRGAYAAA